jgi:selenocysteine lyase/cysteine desulfurase
MREVAQLVHRYGGLCFFDCAAYASHASVFMIPRDERGREIEEAGADAVFLSPHKLHGGPG